jgi:hypothetical protein
MNGPVTTDLIPECGHRPHRTHLDATIKVASNFLSRALNLTSN